MSSKVKDQSSKFDRSLYWERRQRGVRGQVGYVNVGHTVQDEKGANQIIPMGYRRENSKIRKGKNRGK